MADFINTIDALGDENAIISVIEGNLDEFKDSNIKILGSGVFRECALKTLDLPSLTKITGTHAFEICSKLETVNLPSVEFIPNYVFTQVPSVTSVYFPVLKECGSEFFNNCPKLLYADCPSLTKLGWVAFTNCTTLKALILRSQTMCSLSGSKFSNNGITQGIGYIYVPRALIDTYKTATNWSTYADSFRALEDYTVDGTITGELDESKI